ncbi:MAG: dihydrolipoyl dehydrogenase [Paludibacteraceae bacterium]|nr:dihydrolipoyl dehydrogenase [Paludibacteraceae bacterium]
MTYNLAIIGGGPAGYTAAEKAAKAGMTVVLFEKETVGGTCLNVGCIPTKTLLYSAKQYHNALEASKYGVTAENVSFDYLKIQQRKQKVVRKLVAGVKQRLKDCTFVSGEAEIVSYSGTQDTDSDLRQNEGGLRQSEGCLRQSEGSTIVITCGGEIYNAENLLISTGSQNFVPPITGVDALKAEGLLWDSTDALNAKELPKSIIIVGGGVIGMEFATLYNTFGTEVTVVEALPQVLATLDQDCVQIVKDGMQKQGIRFLTSTKVTEFKTQNDNAVVIAENDEAEVQLEAERVLVCVGRRANLKGLENLKELEYERGAIKINDFCRTNLRNVYAAGDVTGKIMLAHVASRQAEVAVGRMLGQIPVQRIAYSAIPSVVYTNPELASVGPTEKQLTDMQIEFEVKSLPMAFSGRFVAENEGQNGLCKILIDKKHKTLLAVHCVGNPCSEFISTASFAVRMGYTLSEFEQVVFPHPTVSEILRETVIF